MATTNTTDTNSPTPPQGELEQQIEQAVAELSKSSSDNELTRIGWLVHGLDLWHRTDGKMGHSKDEATRYVISSVARLITAQVHAAEARGRREALQEIVDKGYQRYRLQFSDETMPDRSLTQSESEILHRNLAALQDTTGEEKK